MGFGLEKDGEILYDWEERAKTSVMEKNNTEEWRKRAFGLEKKKGRKNMKLVIQRVDEAKVTVDEAIIGRISKGLLILVGVSDTDTTDIADKMLDKALKMRIFDDESGKTNLSLSDVGGELLLVSQFTLYANCKKGHRPSFMEAGKPEHAKALYEYMLTKANDYCDVVQHGSFGAHMHVSLVGNGPFTIVLDSKELLGC